jgi:hypothetical protein
MNVAASEQMNTAMSAISSGVPKRASGTLEEIICITLSLSFSR